MIEVVTGLIISRGRVLFTQRSATKKEFPFGWETPGGKVEAGETHFEALRREFKEELNIDVLSVSRPLWTLSFKKEDAGTKSDFSITFYRVEQYDSSEMSLVENQAGLGWFLPQELDLLQLLPANRKLINEIKTEILNDKS